MKKLFIIFLVAAIAFTSCTTVKKCYRSNYSKHKSDCHAYR